LAWPDWCLNPQSTTLQAKTLINEIVCIVFLLKFKWEMHVSIFKYLLFVILEGFKFWCYIILILTFVSFIMVRTSYIQWNHHVCFFLDKHAYVIESLKCKLTETTVYVGPCKHIILLPSQSVFTRALTPYCTCWGTMYIGVSRRETSSFEERGTLKGMYCNLVYCILFQYKC
jgi:hypothetical protein